MGNFKYVTKDQSGNTLTGMVEAKDRNEAIADLRKRDLIIISLNESSPAMNFSFSTSRKVGLEDLVIFSRQLATMVDAGIPLVGALDILGEQMDNKTFGAVITSIRRDVETGSSLSEGLAKHKKIFSSLFVNMVKAGEASGMLDDILERLAVYLEKTNALQHKVKSALVYPAVVSSMAILITLFLLIKVIPVFKDIFASFNATLPTPTLILVNISDFVRAYYLFAFGFLGLMGFLIMQYAKTEKGRLMLDSFLLNMPIFGILLKKVAISKFTRTLSTLIKSGVPILSALEIVGKTSGNKVVELAIDNVRTNVREGENIADPLARSKLFPPMVTRMISVGEQAGELEKMLTKIADFYDEQVDTAVSGLTSLIEPLIIAFLGLVIGTIVVCMFLPIFKITTLVM